MIYFTRLLLPVLVLFFTKPAYCQETEDSSKTIVCTFPDISAAYPGGNGSWVKHITRNAKGISPGTHLVEIEFLIAKDGIIDSLKVISRHGSKIEKKIRRAILSTSKWDPAIKSGRNVSEWRQVSFMLILPKQKRERKSRPGP